MPRKPNGDRAQTSTEKVRALRERRAAAGLTELRGTFVPTELHAEAKAFIAEWLAQRKSAG